MQNRNNNKFPIKSHTFERMCVFVTGMKNVLLLQNMKMDLYKLFTRAAAALEAVGKLHAKHTR